MANEEDKRSNVDSWKLPISMLIFLNTMFNTKTSVKVTPWLSLKKSIYEIYEMRALRCGELEGSVGSSYVTLDEFTCLYFLSVRSW